MRLAVMGLIVGWLSALAGGCGTMNAARPMAAGEHKAGVTFGGPFTTSLGPPIPIPLLTVGGRSGLNPIAGKPLDVNYGLNATGLAFGLVGLHGGGTIHLLEGEGKRPALSVTERIFVFNNWFDSTKPKASRKAYGINELDVTVSWMAGNHVLYLGGSDVLDLADPELLVTPFLGAELNPKGKRVAYQLETSLAGANFSPEVYDVTWMSPGTPGHGLITVSLGASWALGAKKGDAQ